MKVGGGYKEKHRELVSCPGFRKYLVRGSLAVHFQIQHGMSKEVPGQDGEGEGRGYEPIN